MIGFFATVQNAPKNDGDKKERNTRISAPPMEAYELLHAILIQVAAVDEAGSYPQPD